MAQILEKKEFREEAAGIINVHASNEKDWSDNSIKGIIKAVEWPSFKEAVTSGLCTMVSSAVIGGILYVYGYAVNQLVSLIM